jgi:1,4-alpha-glucan branching enzyme
MKRKPSTYIHMPDLYIFDKHIVGRRKVLPLIKPVAFRIHAPDAKVVWLAGKFSGDQFKNHNMKKKVDGYWECSVDLKRGHYEYHFLVDGVPTVDPKAITNVVTGDGRTFSVVEVG